MKKVENFSNSEFEERYKTLYCSYKMYFIYKLEHINNIYVLNTKYLVFIDLQFSRSPKFKSENWHKQNFLYQI